MTIASQTLLQNARTGTIPTEQGALVLKEVIANSAVMGLAKYEPMTKPKKTFTYLASGVGAYWVNETDVIQTSKPTWLTAEMEAKKLAVIIPASKEFLNYTVSGFFEAMKPEIAEAFYTTFDLAAMFGVNSPYAAGQSIWADINTAGNKIEMNSIPLYDALNGIMGMVEDNDGEPNGFVTIKSNRQKLRGEKGTDGKPIFTDANSGTPSTLLGEPVGYVAKQGWDRTKAEIVTGDWNFARYGILQGIEYSITEEASLSSILDASGNPINLWERDMFALKATMMVGFMKLKDGNFAAITPDVTP